ncbi:MAG: FTR1 family protein [Chthoniobacteraceae bacterium]|jgi:high-affinity iron transporter
MSAPANLAKFSVADVPVADVPVDTKPIKTAIKVLLVAAAAIVAGVLIWQGLTAAGNPDPTKANTSRLGAIMDVGVLVFREGLECILVLAAITANMTGEKRGFRRPVVTGAATAFAATVATWFIAIGILHDIGNDVSALNLQAATGLLAVVVLLIVMNWFFHKVYWGGWISLHNRRKKELLDEVAGQPGAGSGKLWWGLALLGFASLYREGFEVVLFLQGYYLKMGSGTVLTGAAIGLGLSAVVAMLTFVGQRRLPYRKMLIFTGILLGMVLLVMVGEQAQEMQQANWLHTTTINCLVPIIPDWAGLWFSVFPTVETLAAQALAAALVIGSYYGSRWMARR